MTKELVAEKVREELKHVQINGITLEVVADDIYQVDNWWRVPVRPSRWPKRMFELYEALAEVEDDIQEREQLNILLATGRPQMEEKEPEVQAA